MNAQEQREQRNALNLLAALYELGRADVQATPAKISEATGLTEKEVAELMRRLAAESLVDPDACRLTMQGLVLAVSHSGSLKLSKLAA